MSDQRRSKLFHFRSPGYHTQIASERIQLCFNLRDRCFVDVSLSGGPDTENVATKGQNSHPANQCSGTNHE